MTRHKAWEFVRDGLLGDLGSEAEHVLPPAATVSEKLFAVTLKGDLGMDELDADNLKQLIANSFKINATEIPCSSWVTVGDVVSFLEEMVS